MTEKENSRKKEKTNFLNIVLVLIAAAAILFFLYKFFYSPSVQPGAYDNFTQCLNQSGAKMYGAYWCPHCQNQKKMLGNSQYLPYVECSNSDNTQTQECSAAGIQGYPTWVFADGTKAPGEQSLQFLSDKTGCELP